MTKNNQFRVREINNMIIVEELNHTSQTNKSYYKTVAYWDKIDKTGNINLNALAPDKDFKTFNRWKNSVKKDTGVIITQTL